MHGLPINLKEGLPSARDLSLEKSTDSYLCFRLALLHQVSCFFLLYWSLPTFLCTAFDAVSFNIDEVLSINRSANVFVFGDVNIHYKDSLTYSGGTDRLVNSVIIFLSQMTSLSWLTFLRKSQSVALTVLLIWIYFFHLTLVFILQWLSIHWEILIMLLFQFSMHRKWNFPLRIASVNMTKSAGNCGFGHIYWRNP